MDDAVGVGLDAAVDIVKLQEKWRGGVQVDDRVTEKEPVEMKFYRSDVFDVDPVLKFYLVVLGQQRRYCRKKQQHEDRYSLGKGHFQ